MATRGLKHFSGEVVEEKFLTCSICLEKFKTPKLLPCLHTFCLKCLKDHVDRSGKDGSFPCPNCRQPTDVPTNTDTGFKTNFFMNSLLDFFADTDAGHTCSFCLSIGKTENAVSKCIDCSDYLCQDCTGVHGRTRQTVKHKVISIDQLVGSRVDKETSAKAGFPCSEHPEENVRYYCTVCEKPVCRDCKALDHHQHHCIAFREAAKKRKPKMKESLTFLNDQLSTAEKLKVSAEEDLAKGKTLSERYVQEIERIYTEAMTHLMSLKTQTINQINGGNAAFQKEMTSEINGANMRCTQVKSFREYLTNVLNVGTDVEILETYSLARKQNLCPRDTPEEQDWAEVPQDIEEDERIYYGNRDVCRPINLFPPILPPVRMDRLSLAEDPHWQFDSQSAEARGLLESTSTILSTFASTIHEMFTDFINSWVQSTKMKEEELLQQMEDELDNLINRFPKENIWRRRKNKVSRAKVGFSTYSHQDSFY